MATSLLAIVVPCSILLFYGWQVTTVVTSPVPPDSCQDHVGMGMCKEIPEICNNTYASRICPLTCGFCDPQFPIVDPPHFTTDDDCIDRIVNGLTCDQLDNICGDRMSTFLCASTCNFCRPKERNCTLPDSTVCVPHLCDNSHLASILCPHLCGLCNVPSTTTLSHVTAQYSTTSSSLDGNCEDKLADNSCTTIPNFCKDPYAHLLCPKTCGFCCEDHVRPGLTCQQLEEQSKNGTPLCADPLGQAACKKFCGFCTSA